MNEKTAAELQQELLEAKAQIADLKPEVAPKKKDYSKSEIDAFKKEGHIIGNKSQKLSEGHDEEDLQKWDMWLVELDLADVGKLPEIGEAWSIPISLIALKKEKSGKVGNDKNFQEQNKSVNFRERGANKQLFMNFPQNTVEAGKKYDCHYWVETTGIGINNKKNVHLLVKEFPQVTGASTDKSNWGRA